MFDWFWEFLYGITAAMCKLIDGVMQCANKLCGVDNIKVSGEETDFLSFLLRSDEIRLAFIVAAIIGLVISVFFAVIAMVKNVVKGKIDESPQRVCMKVLKAILMFMLVPATILTFMWCLNEIMKVMYSATLNGSTGGIGQYLVGAFSKEGVQVPDGVDYTDADLMWNYFNLKKYQFFFSWITCFIILIETAKALILFVDRAISIAILFVVSPFSIATTVLDDGAHFKLWRDKVLVKFINGYGTILALNIYAMICALVSRNDVIFFDNEFINFLMKVLIIVGGAFSLQRIMGLIGDLVSANAGTSEMQQAAMANQGMKGLIGRMGNAVKGTLGSTPLAQAISGMGNDFKKKQVENLKNRFTGADKKPNPEQEYKNNVMSSLSSITQQLGALSGGGDAAKKAIQGNKDKKDDKKDAVKDAINGGDKKEEKGGNHNALNSALTGGNDMLGSNPAQPAATE